MEVMCKSSRSMSTKILIYDPVTKKKKKFDLTTINCTF